jgi:hypothetical protein
LLLPVDRVSLRIRLKPSSTVPDPAPGTGGSGFVRCPVAPSPSPGERGLRCRHVSRSSRPASRCGRALASPHVPWNRARLPTGEASVVATCPAVPDPSLDAGGLWCCHMSCGTGPASQQGRAPVSPCVLRFQTYLLVREGSSIVTCHMVFSVLWATSKRDLAVYLLGQDHLPPRPRRLISGSS